MCLNYVVKLLSEAEYQLSEKSRVQPVVSLKYICDLRLGSTQNAQLIDLIRSLCKFNLLYTCISNQADGLFLFMNDAFFPIGKVRSLSCIHHVTRALEFSLKPSHQ
jgi:hypothetical protein